MLVNPDDWRPTPGIFIEGTALEVVRSHNSMSVLAGPGSGKSELLAQRAAYLLSTGICTPPKRILAISFKVTAARNLQERVQQRSGPSAGGRFESLTVHAFAKRILTQFREALNPSLRPASNYKIIFPTRDTWSAFQQKYAATYPEIQQLNANRLASLVGEVPDFEVEAKGTAELVSQLWWRDCLKITPPQLTFDMLMLLACHIVRTEPLVKSAIVNTYTHVFLDEFQDVTKQQYELISEIFRGGPATVTAVGDTNQAIMGWAGALPDIFNKFREDFSAESRKLLFNFRSNSRIVDLINDLSKLFNSTDSVRTDSARKSMGSPPDSLEGWVFSTRAAEGEAFARFVRESLQNNPSLRSHDFVVLTRLRADAVEKRLAPYFAAEGLRLRNDARIIGPLAIQELAEEPVFQFLVAILQMAHGVREGSPFQVCRNILANLEGLDLTTDSGTARSLQGVQTLVASATSVTQGVPHRVDFAELVRVIFTGERRQQLGRIYKEYLDRVYLEGAIEASASFFAECGIEASNWSTFIDNVEGRDSVKLMTIHKSKGLEYHTVIFTEFNDDAFWNNKDDVNVFFVALSRARERIRFSLTQDSKGVRNVTQFIKLLEESGVVFRKVA